MAEGPYERVVRLPVDQRNRVFARVLGDEGLRCQAELSSTQRRFWALNAALGATPALNLTEAFQVIGPLDLTALDTAIQRISLRHNQLRSRFFVLDGVPLRLVSGAPLRLIVDSTPPTGSVRDVVEGEADRVLDLQCGPLLRCRAVPLGAEDHLLLFNVHQLVADGTSLGLFYRELSACYLEAVGGPPAELPELPITYTDHVVHQRHVTEGPDLANEVDFWHQALAGVPVVLDLPMDRPRGRRSERGALLGKSVPSKFISDLDALARQENSTPFMTRLAAYALMLYRYTDRPDLLIGTAVPGRRPVEQNLIGAFANEVAVHADLSGNPTFRTALRRLRRTTIEAFAHAELPAEVLVDQLKVPRNPSFNPLYQVFFTEERQSMSMPGLGIADTRRIELSPRIPARLDVSMAVRTNNDGTAIARVGYEPGLFDQVTMERLVDNYLLTLATVADNPDVLANDVDIHRHGRSPGSVTRSPA